MTVVCRVSLLSDSYRKQNGFRLKSNVTDSLCHVLIFILWRFRYLNYHQHMINYTYSIPLVPFYSKFTFCFTASILDLNFLLLRPVHPAANSGPREVSAVNECFVPLFDSNTNPGKSSRRRVDCYKITGLLQ